MLKNKSGQAMVEFAIITPIFLLILFGIYEIGSALVIQQAITYAVREGARVGGLTNSNTQIESVVADVTDFVDSNPSSINLEIVPPNESERNRGDNLTVKIIYDYPLGFLKIFKNSIILEADASTRIEFSE